MLLKGILYLCIQAVLSTSVFTQCVPPLSYPREPPCPTNCNSPVVERYSLPGVAPFTPIYGRVIGGNLIVDTSAPHAYVGPAGVTIFSDNLIMEGPVFVAGNLPFVGTVGLEGVVPAAGNSAVSYGCGTGDIGMVEIPGPVTEVLLLGGGIAGPGCAGYNAIDLRL